jgi:cyanophycinase
MFMQSSRKMPLAEGALLILLVALVPYHTGVAGDGPRGTLFIIGGGDRPRTMMEEFVALAGGPRARIRIIPNASGDGDTSGRRMAEEFRTLGVTDVSHVLYTRPQAEAPGASRAFDGATGIYFTGGDQVRISRSLVGTPVQQKLLELYRNGAVIGGTSAGAAIMSEVMITGEEKVNTDSLNLFPMIRRGNVETVQGLGFVTDAIIDQHFVRRKRHNRLITVVLEHPRLVGVGIDEATAIVVGPDNTFRVTGESVVVVYDAAGAAPATTDAAGNLASSGIALHVLKAGDRYDLAGRRVQTEGSAR